MFVANIFKPLNTCLNFGLNSACNVPKVVLILCVALHLFQVIKGCSVGQFESGPPFERFDCDSRDVCFRIDRLILDGYLHRCNVKPHVIHYQPSTMELLPSNGQPVSYAAIYLCVLKAV